jgi:RNA polymerase sigma-70 factor (ECF subfamily)
MSADLPLVSACLRGDAAAWETFVSRYRQCVLAFALCLAKNESVAQEIASSVWADLYGSGRSSKLRAYSGRGSLEGWLRTLVAQAYADLYRKERRFVAMDEDSFRDLSEETAFESTDGRLEQALDKALCELTGEQRLVLTAHYLEGRTFAEIGRMLGAHESSVSRQSKKSLELVRKRTAHYLRVAGMSMQEAKEAMDGDVRCISLDVRKRLQLVRDAS